MKFIHAIVLTLFASLAVLFGSATAACAQGGENVRRITDYGAKGDGQTMNTAAINNAIRDCFKSGGGTVVVPPGEYLSGPIEILSNVDLHLDAGAMIKGSPKLEDYPIEQVAGSGESPRAGLVTARHADNITISGRGVIDGNGMTFVDPTSLHMGSNAEKQYTRQKDAYMDPKYGTQDGPLAPRERPGNLIRLFNCKNVLLQGVTIQNSPTWTTQINQCERVTVEGVGINSFGSGRRVPNDDGFDLIDCRGVFISNCDIQTGDDCIAVFGSQRVLVSNCTLSSRSSAVRLGYTNGETRDCIFSNLVIHATNRGLGVYVRGAGSVENILFSDITIQTQLMTGVWWGKAEPIHISAVPWDATTPHLGQIRNIRFRNITMESDNGILIYGCPQSVIRDLSFRDIQVRIRNGPLQKSYGGNFDLRSHRDPTTSLFAHDIPAMFCRYVDGLEIHGMKVEWDRGLPSFFTNGIACEHFKDVEISGFSGRAAQPSNAAIALREGSGIAIRECKAEPGTGTFLSLSGVTGEGLFVNNDLGEAARLCDAPTPAFLFSGNRLPKDSAVKNP